MITIQIMVSYELNNNPYLCSGLEVKYTAANKFNQTITNFTASELTKDHMQQLEEDVLLGTL